MISMNSIINNGWGMYQCILSTMCLNVFKPVGGDTQLHADTCTDNLAGRLPKFQ